MRRLLNFLRGVRLDEDIREEIEFHRAQSSGRFGNATAIQERVRDASTVRWLETLLQDVRYAFRQFRRAPVLVAVATLSLALGIGANTAVFTLINAVMRQWLPVQDPGRLALFYDGITAGTFGGKGGQAFRGDVFAYPDWRYLRAHLDSFESLCAFKQGTDRAVMHVPGNAEHGPHEVVDVHLVSGNYFSVLGVRAAAGRVLRDEDDRLNAGPAGVISYQFWKERFKRDSGVVGKTVVLNGIAVSIVGVAAPEFFGERIGWPPDFWIPLSLQPQMLQLESWLSTRDECWLNMMGRLKPGATLRSAEAALNVRLHQFFTEQAGAHASARVVRDIAEAHVTLKPGGGGISGLRLRYSQPLHILMAVAGLVLLIACANIATLLLARAAAREPEFLARLAVGASRGRLMRQVLTESILLALLSATVGIGFAWWSVKLLIVWMEVDSVVTVRPDAAVLAFTFVMSILTGVVFGIVPAIKCSGLELKPGAVIRSPKFGSAGALIVLQVSLSLVLLFSSGLLAHSLFALVQQDLGFQRENVLLVGTDARVADYQPNELAALYRELEDRMNAIPSVASASLARFSPVSGSVSSNNFALAGYTPQAGKDIRVFTVEVGPHFFDTLRIPVLLGRPIGALDTPASPEVAVVNETFVRMYLAGRNPLGQHISLHGSFHPPGAEIVGVVKDSKYYDLREKPQPMAYYALAQPRDGEFTYAREILLRTSHDAASIGPEVRRVMKRFSSKLPVLQVTTLEHQIDESIRQQRLIASLCSALGIMALVLASIGIYGTLSYSVARRTSEIGIRMAIGAQRAGVLWMVLQDCLVLIGAGVVLGLPMALMGTRWIKSLLFGVSAADPLAIGGAVLLIVLLALFAAYVPARRATKIDPVTALKYE